MFWEGWYLLRLFHSTWSVTFSCQFCHQWNSYKVTQITVMNISKLFYDNFCFKEVVVTLLFQKLIRTKHATAFLHICAHAVSSINQPHRHRNKDSLSWESRAVKGYLFYASSGSKYSFVCFNWCQEFGLSYFCLLNSFTFIFPQASFNTKWWASWTLTETCITWWLVLPWYDPWSWQRINMLSY